MLRFGSALLFALIASGCSLAFDGSTHVGAECARGGGHMMCNTDNGEVCVQGECDDSCDTDADCNETGYAGEHPWGTRCITMPGFEPACGCADDEDCGDDEFCSVQSICIPEFPCTTQLACNPLTDGTFCIDGNCQSPALCAFGGPDACGPGFVCARPPESDLEACLPRCGDGPLNIQCPPMVECLESGMCDVPPTT